VAALIMSRTGIQPDLIEGSRGEFSVWVGDSRVAEKDANGFPEDDKVLEAVQKSLAHSRGPDA
jgi:hypothetical protein